MKINEIKYWLYFKWTDLKFWYECLNPQEQFIILLSLGYIMLCLLFLLIILNCHYNPNNLICWNNQFKLDL